MNNSRANPILITAALLVAVGIGVFVWRGANQAAAEKDSASTVDPAPATAAATTPAVLSSAITNPPPGPGLVPDYDWFQRRPFAVFQTNGNWQWTAENAMDSNVLRHLAHNDLEYERLLAENETIFRRQLVYHQGAFSLQAQAARLGQPVTSATLPGLDGQLLAVDVRRAELEAGGDRGVFSGKLAGRENSLVTITFQGGREAFTVYSPDDDLFLNAVPREPGEIIVASINPLTYGGRLGDGDHIVMPEAE
jgi:hypothetical protein